MTSTATALNIFSVENNKSKACRQISNLITNHGNNYESTHYRIEVRESSVVFSSYCKNEYGSRWFNDNDTEVKFSDIPYFLAKKIGIV